VKVPALAAFLVCTAALAQAPTPSPNPPPDAGGKASAPPSAPADAPAASKAVGSTVQLDEAIQREIDAKVAQAKKELQDEMRAQSATAAATTAGWEDANITSRTKLQLFVAHGYFRVRPELFNYFDLNQGLFNGYYLFPVPDAGKDTLVNPGGHTITGVNMRFRLEPTINVSEELRIKAQFDILDNVVWGSTPAYAYTQFQGTNVALLSLGQVPPQAGINAALSSIAVKQVYGEVSTPVGLFKFGRMQSNFGLGINYNDGSCLDCDFQTDIDAFQFIAEPLPGFFVIPMLEFDVSGLVNSRLLTNAEQLDVTQSDNATSYRIVIARLDTEQQAKAKLASGGTVLNYGLDFSFRTQKYEYLQNGPNATPYGDQGDPYTPSSTLSNRVARFGNLSIPDIWIKVQTRSLRVEMEGVAYLGEFSAPILPGNIPTNVNVVQFGAAGEAEFKILNGVVALGFKGGFASGDKAPGFGVRVTRPSMAPGTSPGNQSAQPGDIDGAQFGRHYPCPGNPNITCTDADIRNYRFNADYHIDQILWRYIIGAITDAWYIRPSATWNITDSLQLEGDLVYSQAIYASSTPSASQAGLGSVALGLEIDLGIRYQTEDGLFAWLYYGLLFPFAGLQNTSVGGIGIVDLHVAQSIRGMVGIKF